MELKWPNLKIPRRKKNPKKQENPERRKKGKRGNQEKVENQAKSVLELAEEDFPPPAVIIIPGKLNFFEKEFLEKL